MIRVMTSKEDTKRQVLKDKLRVPAANCSETFKKFAKWDGVYAQQDSSQRLIIPYCSGCNRLLLSLL